MMLGAAAVDVPVENHAWRQWNLHFPQEPLPDNCSSGIEPAFGWTYRRRVMLGAAAVDVPVENH
ncbi:hypothetical protein CTI14_67830, partial [Methylobacterium radiotolerans]